MQGINFMKAASICGPMEARVKVRYRQEPEPAVIHPTGVSDAVVDYQGIFAPGQLAVFYDSDMAILCAGIINLRTPDYPSDMLT
jgi:tRNA U34 2-thiouridine synthase MnmA/TrmU